jgi:hypothetical protein
VAVVLNGYLKTAALLGLREADEEPLQAKVLAEA